MECEQKRETGAVATEERRDDSCGAEKNGG